jgi:predicted aminopeptidase
VSARPGRGRRWARRIGIALLGLLVTVISLGALLPIGRYLARAAWEEAKILARRRPIEALVADSTVSPDVRRRLQLVVDARAFAQRSLGLRPGESFTTYSPLESDTLVLVLSAARRDTLQAYTWWFPIVGRFPYKGFFDAGDATAARDDFSRRGFDTYLRPAAAFSTLGWFNDPLLSTTLRMDTLDLAKTVIHELTHNTLFVKGDVAFNESLASFVGARGAASFFRERGHERAARRVDAEWADEKQLGAFWSALAHSIDSAFAAHPGDSLARIRAGDSVYRRMRRVLLDDLAPHMPTISRKGLERMQLDNAALLAHRVYASDLWLFDELFRRHGGDLRATVRLVQDLVRRKDSPFAALRDWLATPLDSTSVHGASAS